MLQDRVAFREKGSPPDDEGLRRALGESFALYTSVLKSIGNLPLEWKFYGTKYGWQLKVLQKGKALFYLVPFGHSFRIGFGVREEERELLLRKNLPAKAKEELKGAKKYSEGYPLRFLVSKQADLRAVLLIIGELKAVRS